jgi:hypothetical protein
MTSSYRISKRFIFIVWAGMFVLLLLGGIHHCAMGANDCVVTPIKVQGNTPGDRLCKAELDDKALKRFQSLLSQYGHGDLRVIEGTAYALAKDLKAKTFVVCLKCVRPSGALYAVGVSFVKDQLAGIEIKPVGEQKTSFKMGATGFDCGQTP